MVGKLAENPLATLDKRPEKDHKPKTTIHLNNSNRAVQAKKPPPPPPTNTGSDMDQSETALLESVLIKISELLQIGERSEQEEVVCLQGRRTSPTSVVSGVLATA